MKSKILLGLLILLFAAGAQAQATAHSATLTITPASDAVAATVYNVYRAAGACPVTGTGSLTFTKLTPTPISVLIYTDTTITAGAWCYYVTASLNGVESSPSVTAGGTAKPGVVTFSIVIQ